MLTLRRDPIGRDPIVLYAENLDQGLNNPRKGLYNTRKGLYNPRKGLYNPRKGLHYLLRVATSVGLT